MGGSISIAGGEAVTATLIDGCLIILRPSACRKGQRAARFSVTGWEEGGRCIDSGYSESSEGGLIPLGRW